MPYFDVSTYFWTLKFTNLSLKVCIFLLFYVLVHGYLKVTKFTKIFWKLMLEKHTGKKKKFYKSNYKPSYFLWIIWQLSLLTVDSRTFSVLNLNLGNKTVLVQNKTSNWRILLWDESSNIFGKMFQIHIENVKDFACIEMQDALPIFNWFFKMLLNIYQLFCIPCFPTN